MASTQLDLREVPSVPNLRVANLKTDDGVNLLASAVGTDSVQIVSADGSLEGFGGLTVAGPGVTTIAMDWDAIIKLGIEIYNKMKGGGGGGGGKGCTTTQTTTFDGKGGMTQTTTTSCPGPG